MQSVQVETPTVGFVSKNVKTKEEREKRDQEELEALLEEHGEGQDSQEEDDQEEGSEENDPKADKTSGEEKTWKKRYGDLRRHTQSEISALKEKVDALTKEKEQNPSEIPQDEEEFQKWVNEYPDAARMVEKMASKIADEKFEDLASKYEQLEVTQKTSEREKLEAKIYKAHPDFDELKEDDNFHEWAEEQPKLVQDAIYESTDPDSTIWAISQYKATLKPKPKGKGKASAAEDVPVKGEKPKPSGKEKTISESEVASWDMKTYEKREKEVLEAIEKGNFIYDMSGKN